MPVIRAAQSVVHQMHGTSFTSYASPARGSRELCAWRIEIPGGTEGVPHHVSREEVLYVLSGTLRVSVDGEAGDATAGDVVLVPGAPVRGQQSGWRPGHRLGHHDRRVRRRAAGRVLVHAPVDPVTGPRRRARRRGTPGYPHGDGQGQRGPGQRGCGGQGARRAA